MSNSKPSELLKTLQQLTERGQINNDTLLPMILATLIDVLRSVDELTERQAEQQDSQEHVPEQIRVLTTKIDALVAWREARDGERNRLIGILIGATIGGGLTGGGIVAIVLKALGG